MRSSLAALVLLATAAAPARADDRVEVALARDGGWLELDPTLAPRLDAVGESAETQDVVVAAGRVELRLDTLRWPTGWRIGGRIALDLGDGWSVGGSAALEEVDTELGRGRHVDVGVDVTQATRRSRWMTTWSSFGLGTRRWVDAPPPGEHDTTQLTWTVGTTFR